MLGENHPDTAGSYNNLGYLWRAMGDLAAARSCYEKALEITRRLLGNEHPRTAISLDNVGYILQRMGDLAAAQSCYDQALEIFHRVLGEDHPDTARSLTNLGLVLMEEGLFAAACPYLERALSIHRRLFGNDHPCTAVSLDNLGHLMKNMGDMTAASSCYEEAMEIFRRALGEDHPDTATCRNNLGCLLRDMGELAAARMHLEQALAVRRRVQGNNHPDIESALVNLGVLERDSGRIDEALDLMYQVSALDDRLIGQIFSVGSERQRLCFLQRIQGNQDDFLSLIYQYKSDSPETVRAALALVLRRKALGVESLAVQRDVVLRGRFPHLGEAFVQLTQLRQRIVRKTLDGPAPGETVAAHEETLHQWGQKQQQLETDLARQIPEMNLEQQLYKADRRAIALGLGEGVVLVEFVRFDVFDFHGVPVRGERQRQPARYLAFVLPGGRPDQVQMIDLGKAAAIDRMIANFRDSIAVDPQDRPDRDIRRQRPESLPATSWAAWPYTSRRRF